MVLISETRTFSESHSPMKRAVNRQIENNLAAIRQRRGFSASALAKLVGVSRQAIYAIEAGTYVPNTAVGLRLASVLTVGVEELFRLPESSGKPAVHSVKATLIPSPDKLQPGQPVQLCEVDGRLIAAAATPVPSYLPASDAFVIGRDAARDKIRVRFHEEGNEFRNRLLMAGCDPAMSVLARYLRPAGIELVAVHQNSSRSLALLKNG